MKTKSILLIGLGRFGRHIALRLNDLGHEVMAVDRDEQKINEIMPFVTSAEIGDSTNEQFLKSLGVDSYDVAIVTISGDFQSSLETTYMLKELGAKKVVSRAERDGQAKFLLRNGADEIVYPEKQLASWLATRYSADHLLDYIELGSGFSIFEVTSPKQWIGKSIAEIDIRRRYSVSIIATKSNGKIAPLVAPETVITENMSLFVLGEFKLVQKCFDI